MKLYSYRDEPVKVFGVVDFEKKKKFQRLPDEIIEKIPRIGWMGLRCPGARIGFRTNSTHITVKLKVSKVGVDPTMSIYAASSAYIFAGDRQTAEYLGPVTPPWYEKNEFEGTYIKKNVMEDVLVWLPKNPMIEECYVGIDDDAEIEPPTPYRYPKPVLYYGSSITEGGCPAIGFNVYSSILSRKLDCDFYNYGFSGNALGDIELAEYFATLNISVFVMDYDHNAPSAEYLYQTHERFFRIIREKRPELPIIIMTRPAVVLSQEDKDRRDAIYQTYRHAIDAGDKNVWFVDGMEFFPEDERQLCTIDTCHPNDHGFFLMAKKVEPALREALEKSEK